MAMSQKALQKKREKKKQSRQSKLSKMSSAALPQYITYSRWDLHECWVPDGLWETGMGPVIVSRRSPLGEIAISIYLIDTYCLGIKDCFIRLASPSEYKLMLENMSMSSGEFQLVEPSYAKTLIHKAKDYATRIGFKPHRDFIKVEWMLKNIPLDETHMFTFGKDNKPLYIRGPNESQADVKRIIKTLDTHLGQDKYDYVLEA